MSIENIHTVSTDLINIYDFFVFYFSKNVKQTKFLPKYKQLLIKRNESF